MTSIKVVKQNGKIHSLELSGHSGCGVEGEDIVCSAVSSIIQTAILGLLRVAGVDITYEIYDQNGYLCFSLPDVMTKQQEHDADIILSTMWLGILDLHEGFSDFIELEE